jgi:hypothetical protein
MRRRALATEIASLAEVKTLAVLYSFFVDHYVSGMTGAVKE